MGKQIKNIKDTWCCLREELFVPIVSIAFGMLGSLLMLFIEKVGMANEEKPEWFLLGTVMALVGCVMLGIITGMISYGQSFNMMVTMGRTRKEFYIANFVSSIINHLLGMTAILVFAVLERGFGGLVYREAEYKAIEGFLFDWRVIIAYVLGMAVLRTILGALFLKFGNKLMWVFWGIWMLVGVMIKGISKAMENKNAVMLWLLEAGKGFLNLAKVLQVLIMLAVSAVFVLFAWLITRKRAVTV